MSDDEIKAMAQEFIDEFMNLKDSEIECPICTAINCINNVACINCNYILS